MRQGRPTGALVAFGPARLLGSEAEQRVESTGRAGLLLLSGFGYGVKGWRLRLRKRETMGTRADLETLLDKIAKQLPVRSNAGDGRFDNYCGPCVSEDWAKNPNNPPLRNWQERLEYDWFKREKKRNTTCCNEFAGHIVRMVGGPYIGGMGLRSSLDGAGAAYAWVEGGPGAKPKKGDILQFDSHIGVAYDFQQGILRHIDAGQGGPNRGFDEINFVVGGNLLGYADMDKVLNKGTSPPAAPSWLAGWWTLTWQGTRYWYYFGKGGLAQYQKVKPRNLKGPGENVWDAGAYLMRGGSEFNIKWRQTGSTEEWKQTSDTTMTGVYNGQETLSATKLTS